MNPKEKFLAYNSTIVGVTRAVLERLIYIHEDGEWKDPPTPLPGIFNKRLENFTSQFKRYVTRQHPLEHIQFAMCYHGPRRKRYLRAAENLRSRSVTQKDAMLKFFLKLESYDFIEKENPCPRGINPRTDEYLCSLGCYLHPLEKKVYRIIEKIFGYKVVMKGFNQQQRGAIFKEHWDAVDRCVYFPIDAKRFEQSVGEDALKWEHSLYEMFFKGDKHLKRLLKWQLLNKGKARTPDGFMFFMVTGRRMSGDMNTALGNCLISAALMFAFMEHCKIEKYRAVCDGDDCGLFVADYHIPVLEAELDKWYREMGFRMTVGDIAHVLEHADFCQSRPVNLGDQYVMVRNPVRALSKDSLSKKPLDSLKNYRRWIASVGQGGLSTSGGVPVSQSFYHCLVRNSCGAKPLKDDPSLKDFMSYKVQGMSRKFSKITDVARASFSLAFGISPAAQECAEDYYDNLQMVHGERRENLIPLANLCW